MQSLPRPFFTCQHSLSLLRISERRSTYIDWKLPTDPLQLRRVACNLMNPTHMRLLHIHSVGPQLVDCGQVRRKHVWVLVIFGRYVLFDRGGEGEMGGSSERYL
ncbi:hypothetical protein Q9L58_004279 [Maublancomyces gigas]|uniref:Uncharacterized protein n=1 Tax=Discina gigas TaxID=1032678 RepID=A0ABR3GM78_9PEZI